MNWRDVITGIEKATELIGEVDPAVAATTDEIAALTQIASTVINVVAVQTGAPIADVLAGLTPEEPIA